MMETAADIASSKADALRAVLSKHWGYHSLRPLQGEAMAAAVDRRDALVVLPTGGGKSLCYQAPALLADKPTVVLSPLISLMKDQVDPLIQRGIPAAYLNSSLDPGDQRRVCDGISRGQYKLVFVAPERLAGDGFRRLLDESGVGAFAIDEAHCISHWGHDFRADYRQLGQLKKRHPDVPVHAFTATATPRVREDIVTQLGLNDPIVLVGDFFRPNLAYSVQRRGGGFIDVVDAVRQRRGQAGIVYCIRRTDVDELAAELDAGGVRVAGYHAGMDDEERTRRQDDFAAGRVDVVVATVAFGMGIDRADIRYVIHAAMPKSIEHYQQETGRAGRDGQPAECILFYSGGDFGLWKSIMDSGDASNRDEQSRLLGEMYRYCTATACRHRRLVTYFGQVWERESCGACDFCNEGPEPLADSTVTAQKIMSCVVRTGQRFGAAHVADVLTAKVTEKVTERNHDQLSTFGLLGREPKRVVMEWIDQLVDQGMLDRHGEYRTLLVTKQGWQVLRSQAEASLYQVAHGRDRTERKPRRPTRAPLPGATSPAKQLHAATAPRPLDADEQALFERLRVLRRDIADELNVPAFVVFSDKTLRELSRVRPTSKEAMLAVKGVGPAKYARFGKQFIDAIRGS
ncbi:MAG: DNA helicase RecQ [Planctomycetota bacterium]|jgi:ATP-dependent DNA helicase RecQ